MDIEAHPFDLRDCVESALDLIARRAAEKQLDIAYLFEGDVPAAVNGDVTRLRQILLNLLANAVKFTEAGEVVLTVSATAAHGGEVELTFAVRDTGIGLIAEGMGRLFQSFSQADSSTTRKYGGTGLGLAISKRLAELMGGRMWAQSAGPGQGSTFLFTIRAPVAELPPARPARLHRRAAGAGGQAVLVVDDNATNRKRAGAADRQVGDAVRGDRIAGRGAAVARGGRGLRPGHPGHAHARAWTASRSPRRIRAAARALPLVLFSSLGRREAGDNEGLFAAYLVKPLRQSQLFDTLVSLLAHDAAPRPEPRRRSRRSTPAWRRAIRCASCSPRTTS